MRFANTPSAGNTDFLVSGGVLTGVMVSVILSGALDGAAREEAVAFMERGLGSLPGGLESELVVRGVRTETDIG